MSGPMGRRRRHDLDLPPLMYSRTRGGARRYYYGQAGIALGDHFPTALRKYAELHTGSAGPGTFADAACLYQREELARKAPKTQKEYTRQLATLVRVFGAQPLPDITPGDVHDFLGARPPHAGAREKALLSAVFNFSRRRHLTTAPNPCAGVRAPKARRSRYVADAELSAAVSKADPALAAYLELCYRTGQRPGDVVRMRRQDVRDGALWVDQAKTGAKLRVALAGPLAALLARLQGGVASVYLIHDARGQPYTLAALRKRFDRLGCDWQIRDLRAKAASDADSARAAQALLGHSAASTTDGYIRQTAGALVQPIVREIDGSKGTT